VRVLFVGDSPTVSTGFAKCTRFACEALHLAGHEIHILGINEFGDPHSYPYKIYPCISPLDGCQDPFGVGRLPLIIDRVKPDLIILLNDPWNVPEYFNHLKWINERRTKMKMEPVTIPPIVGWLAVDSRNQKGAGCNDLAHVIVWTEFAGQELVKGGYTGQYSIVPLGVDLDTYYPRSKSESRSKVCPPNFPTDFFIVGVVGRNQPRKRLDLTIQYFSEWVHRFRIDNAYLYLHVSPTGERGCDIRSLVHYYGLQGKVLVSNPEAGFGLDESLMPFVYSAFDVYLSTSQGEGFGLPALESMACGTPVIVPGCGGYDSWIPDGTALKVPCSHTALTAPLNDHPYTIGGVIDGQSLIDYLNKLYTFPPMRDSLSNRGLELAKSLTWNQAGRNLVKTIDEIMVNIKSKSPIERQEIVNA
jgi:D-inositol-3-phosphate glycosyltransferase